MTLPGVGLTGAQALYAALGDWRRFKDGAHAASYLGLTPSTRQSADHCYHGSITKAGNSLARWLLTQAARQVIQHPGPHRWESSSAVFKSESIITSPQLLRHGN